MKAQTKLIGIGAIFMILLSGIIILAVFEDVEGPIIYEIDILPVSPVAGDTISVVIYCIDSSGVSDAKLSYSIDGEDWKVQDMNFYTCLCLAGGRWVANIGPVELGNSVVFFATAYDDSPTKNTADSETFTIQIEA